MGLLSYKCVEKVSTENGLIEMIEASTNEFQHADVIAFLSPPGETLLRQARMTHGVQFIEVWHELLRRLGFGVAKIKESDELEMFFSNYWVAKPAVMMRFIDFIGRAVRLVERDAKLKIMLQADARYLEGSSYIARRVFKTTFYQLHPFIFERLAVVFFWSEHRCVVIFKTQFRSRLIVNQVGGPIVADK